MSQSSNSSQYDLNFQATGIGSVPFLEIEGTCRDILSRFPEAPFWPQFVRRSPLEDMNIQFTEGLPLLQIDEQTGAVTVSSKEREKELVRFYELFFEDQTAPFAISDQYAPGLHTLLRLIQEEPDQYGPFIKGQSVGPITLAAFVRDDEGKSILYDRELCEAVSKGLAIKALWQTRELGKTGKKPIFFFDEPYLSGYGSAFTSIQREDVIELLKDVVLYLKERADVLVGIHCCGNTDWAMIVETDVDLINFDAYDYLSYFLLYRDDLFRFLQRGGNIAWGIVPTFGYTGEETAEALFAKLETGLEQLVEWGVKREDIISHSILTPACGMGSMTEEASHGALSLLGDLMRQYR